MLLSQFPSILGHDCFDEYKIWRRPNLHIPAVGDPDAVEYSRKQPVPQIRESKIRHHLISHIQRYLNNSSLTVDIFVSVPFAVPNVQNLLYPRNRDVNVFEKRLGGKS